MDGRERHPPRRMILCVVPTALTLACLLVLVNRVLDPRLAILLGIASFSSVLTISLLLRLNRKAHARKTLRDGLVEYLYKVIYYRLRKGSYFNAVDRASASTGSHALRSLVVRASKSFRLGGSFLEGIRSAEDLRSDAVLESLRCGPSDERAMNGIISAHNLYLSARQAAVEASSQRDAVLNMFISTILPSFILFAFVGSTIISQAGLDLLAASVLLIVLVPLFYSMGTFLMWRRLLE